MHIATITVELHASGIAPGKEPDVTEALGYLRAELQDAATAAVLEGDPRDRHLRHACIICTLSSELHGRMANGENR